jgi:hypothetical protein
VIATVGPPFRSWLLNRVWSPAELANNETEHRAFARHRFDAKQSCSGLTASLELRRLGCSDERA